MTAPHFHVLTSRPDVALIEAEGELWAPDVAELREEMRSLVAGGCRTIELDLSRAAPGFLAGELVTEVVNQTSESCAVLVDGWRPGTGDDAPATAPPELRDVP
ncbi:hypothetical protein [Cellulomonas sp. ICMP 17802]|uniref:hypothetical protein n=1 Tax=Cellulomonas sp. ICMP 17802 TaxID=3239199 RepID=UPI00351B1784